MEYSFLQLSLKEKIHQAGKKLIKAQILAQIKKDIILPTMHEN